MPAGVGPHQPLVDLIGKIERVGKDPASLEVAVQVAMIALKRAFGLSVAGIKDDPAETHLPEVSGEVFARVTAAFAEGRLLGRQPLSQAGRRAGSSTGSCPS